MCSGSSRPVPWGVITASPSHYLEPGSVPTGFVVKDPSHMKTEEVNRLWNHWERRSAAKHKLVVFIKAKDSDIRSNLRNEERKRKSKKQRVSLPDTDDEDQGQPVPLNGSDFTGRRSQLAAHSNTTTPDDVATKDHYTFMESLTKNENYLELVDAIRDLAILSKQTVGVT
jgi:hypothetical protein